MYIVQVMINYKILINSKVMVKICPYDYYFFILCHIYLIKGYIYTCINKLCNFHNVFLLPF